MVFALLLLYYMLGFFFFVFWLSWQPDAFNRGVKESCPERGSGSEVSTSEDGADLYFFHQEAHK